MEKLKPWSRSIGLAGAVATLSDLAQPIAPFAAYLMGVTGISIIILALTKYIFGYWHENLSTSFCFSFLLLTLSTVLFIYQGTSTENHESGVIASNIQILNRFQSEIGIIKESTLRSEKHLSSIDKKLDNVKKETSFDPRKELANSGVSWDEDNYLLSIERGDLSTIELFLKGGMSPNTDHWMCLPVRLSLNTTNPVEVYMLLKKYNLQINKLFKTGIISGPQRTTLLTEAISHKNKPLIKTLLNDKVHKDIQYEIYAGAGFSTKKVNYDVFLKSLKLPPDIQSILRQQ